MQQRAVGRIWTGAAAKDYKLLTKKIDLKIIST